MNEYIGDKGQEYYDMRKARRSDFVQERRASHFQPLIKKTNTVLDFGCGTGGILSRLDCAKKIGIELNPPSVEEAKSKGLNIHSDFKEIGTETIDIIISNHALEHVLQPTDILAEMKRVLKKDGRLVLVVPSENPARKAFSKWSEHDPDKHTYSWTPLSFGNLVCQSGFEIIKTERRPIGYSKYIEPLAGINEALFQVARKIVAFLLDRYEIVCIAKK